MYDTRYDFVEDAQKQITRLLTKMWPRDQRPRIVISHMNWKFQSTIFFRLFSQKAFQLYAYKKQLIQ